MKRILLYGATGYSGGLIAREVRARIDDGDLPEHEVVLGGRDRARLEELTNELNLAHIVFTLDDRARVDSVLSEFDVVINAAGPFADTGMRLAKAAISNNCNYVDINGEVGVYRYLDDLARLAEDREVRLVSGAGFTATVSDVMLRWAITLLRKELGDPDRLPLGAVRVAVSDCMNMSRGSVLTLIRSVREQVVVVRNSAYVHVPVGQLERSFDFGSSQRRVASAANLVDTCTALETARDCKADVGAIESYIEMPLPVRLGYQWGAWAAVYASLPGIRNLTELQIAPLPDGPDENERKESRHTVLLQVESPHREPWVDWLIDTPSSYDVTARTALEVAVKVTDAAMAHSVGWLTPSDVLRLPPPMGLGDHKPVPLGTTPLQDCTIVGRPVMAPAA